MEHPNGVKTVRIATAVLVGVLAVSGCNRGGPQKPNADATHGTSTGKAGLAGNGEDNPSPTPSAAGSSAAAASLPDGKSPTYLTGLDVSAKTVTFDLIQFLEGDAARKAYVKVHPDEPDGPPEGYYIVNDNPQLRSLPISAQVKVRVLDFNAPGAVAPRTIKLTDLPAYFTHDSQYKPEHSDRRLSTTPYWLTVSHGQVTLIEEQYLP
jgi:hypothetical protein